MKGSITAHLPSHVKNKNLWKNKPKEIRERTIFWGVKLGKNLKKYKNRTLKTRATTPPNLLGIERKISYANKKYHSGWMWTGLTIGLAGIQFSGSPKTQGEKKLNP